MKLNESQMKEICAKTHCNPTFENKQIESNQRKIIESINSKQQITHLKPWRSAESGTFFKG